MTNAFSPPPGGTNYRSAIDELIKSWDSQSTLEARAKHSPEVRGVVGFAAASYRSAAASTVLWDAGFQPESAPNARACFESALFAAWVQQNGSAAIDATVQEAARQATNLRSQLVKADFLATIAGAAAPQFNKVPLSDEAKVAEKLCSSFAGGATLYLIYRLLSGEAHAIGALRRHLAKDVDGELCPIKEPTKDATDIEWMMYAVSASLIWAARACAEIELNKPGKKFLRGMSKSLDVYPILHRK